jgi:hypothetical protein
MPSIKPTSKCLESEILFFWLVQYKILMSFKCVCKAQPVFYLSRHLDVLSPTVGNTFFMSWKFPFSTLCWSRHLTCCYKPEVVNTKNTDTDTDTDTNALVFWCILDRYIWLFYVFTITLLISFWKKRLCQAGTIEMKKMISCYFFYWIRNNKTIKQVIRLLNASDIVWLTAPRPQHWLGDIDSV